MSAAKVFWTVILLGAAVAVGFGLGRYDWPAPPWAESSSQPPTESALDHAVKHLDPTYVCPMHPQIVRSEPGQCPICGMDLVPMQMQTGPGQSAEVTVSPEVVHNLGVRTAKVIRTDIWRRIDTLGAVDYDEERLVHVHVREEGWLERLAVRAVGQPVRKGQLLFEIYAPQILQAQEDFLLTLRGGDPNLIRSARSRLEKLGMGAEQIDELAATRQPNPRLRVYAPQDGIVTELRVREGQYVQPMTDAVLITDLSEVWLLAEVFERQTGWVAVGKDAEAVLPWQPGQVLEGKVDYIYPTVDPKTRNVRVRLRFPNPRGELKPGMYAEVTIYGGKHGGVLAVPREAVIREPGRDRVVVALEGGRFEPRPVRIGLETEDMVEIVEGLHEGEVVVTSAHFLIDSEASRRASFLRMQPTGGAGHAGSHH